MKANKPLPPTDEDIGVIHFRLFHGHTTSLMRESDRRDAELMHALVHQHVECSICWRGMPFTWRPSGLAMQESSLVRSGREPKMQYQGRK